MTAAQKSDDGGAASPAIKKFNDGWWLCWTTCKVGPFLNEYHAKHYWLRARSTPPAEGK